MDKQALRARFRQQRAALSSNAQVERDAEILSRLLVLPEYRRCTTVFTYVSKCGEVSTDALIQAAWANGKHVAVPRCIPLSNELRFYRITDWTQLQEGTFGVREPIDACPEVNPAEPTAICIVPGLCFDIKGYRVGYGRGYYDRFLPSFTGKTIGLCPSAAVLLRVPRESTDRPVEIIITEQYVRKCTDERKMTNDG